MPTAVQMLNVMIVSTTITGTKYPATRSASSCDFGLENFASSTMLAISLIVLLPGRCVKRTRSVPGPLIDPAITDDPGYFSTGRASPVTMDSSTSLDPEMIVPSVAMRESGAALSISPYWSSRASIVSSILLAGFTIRAVATCKDLIEMDSTAFCLAKALTRRPSIIRVTKRVLVSKKEPVDSGRLWTLYTKETMENIYAVVVLRTINKSISITRVKMRLLKALE